MTGGVISTVFSPGRNFEVTPPAAPLPPAGLISAAVGVDATVTDNKVCSVPPTPAPVPDANPVTRIDPCWRRCCEAGAIEFCISDRPLVLVVVVGCQHPLAGAAFCVIGRRVGTPPFRDKTDGGAI